MYLLRIVLLVKTIRAMDIEITGEFAFDLKISNLSLKHRVRQHRQHGQHGHHEHSHAAKDRVMRTNMTAAPLLDCIYQYPEQIQIDAMLSNMMNQLTEVFVRAHEFIKRSNSRRMRVSRFSVVNKKDTMFFERIYNNMTQEYQDFYNSTTARVSRSDRDPCTHQEEIKRLWLELLDAASRFFRRASLRCMEEYLKYENVPEPKLKKKLEQFLLEGLERIKSIHLTMLCDTFQLCYNELQ